MRITHSGLAVATGRIVLLRRTAQTVTAEAREDGGLEIRLGRRGRQVDVGVGDGVEKRPDQLGAADRGAALGADVRREPIEKYDLPVEQHDRDLRPCFVVHRRAARPAARLRAGSRTSRAENVLAVLAGFPLAAIP